MRKLLSAVAATVMASALALSAVPASATPDTDSMTVTFIRHGESAGNASKLINTSTPGPALTDKGRAEAAAIAEKFANKPFDKVFASTMIRTQQTAEPTAARRHLTVTPLAGFREIEAGSWEGTPEADALETYFGEPQKWMTGNLDARIPGSLNGYEFDKRFDDALETVARSGAKSPVVFAHGGSIMMWTMINTNADRKLFDTRLKNTGYVVVKGSPKKGWTFVEWVADPTKK